MRVDQTGRDRAARRIDPGEPGQREAVSLELSLDRGPLTDGRDPALPHGDDRRRSRIRSLSDQPGKVALPRPAAHAARERDDLARTHDEQAGRRFAGSPAFDDAERAAGHVPGRASAVGPELSRAASSRRSRICCIGE